MRVRLRVRGREAFQTFRLSLILWCRLECGASVGFWPLKDTGSVHLVLLQGPGQPAGSASWWRARAGWAARYGRSRERRGGKTQATKVWTNPYCNFFESTKHQGPETVEYQTSKPQEDRRLLSKHLVANRWRATAVEVQFQGCQQLSHLAAQIAYTRPYIEDSWHREAAGLALTWSCHHP